MVRDERPIAGIQEAEEMRELVGRVSALDSDAGAAVRVITYFDRLVQTRAGLEAIVRGAAMLTGCPVRLLDPDRSLRIRVTGDGERGDGQAAPDPAWPVHQVYSGTAALWLERTGAPGPVDAIVLERAAAAARDVLDRAWGRAPSLPPQDDPALVELLLDVSAPHQARTIAAKRLGLPGDVRARAVVTEEGRVVIDREHASTRESRRPGSSQPGPAPKASSGRADVADSTWPDGKRRGIGPAVPALDLPESWRLARIALRLAAEGTDQDPGPRTVYADELGGLVVLAASVGPGTETVPDVLALERAASFAPWMLTTLHASAYANSLRAAATALTLHHSTLQDRLAHAGQLLGWNIRTPQGCLRLQLAFVLRRLRRHPETPSVRW
jgi:hypothetical protein